MKEKIESDKEYSATKMAETIARKSRLTKKDIEELDKIVKLEIAKAHSL